MNRFIVLSLAICFSSASSFAAERLTCERIGDGKGAQSLAIEIAKDTITTTDLERDSEKPRVWNRDDPGLFSYWGTDSSMANSTNERFIDHVRFEIVSGKDLSTIRAKTAFEMEIAFIWESLYFNSSDLTSEDMYSCKKL